MIRWHPVCVPLWSTCWSRNWSSLDADSTCALSFTGYIEGTDLKLHKTALRNPANFRFKTFHRRGAVHPFKTNSSTKTHSNKKTVVLLFWQVQRQWQNISINRKHEFPKMTTYSKKSARYKAPQVQGIHTFYIPVLPYRYKKTLISGGDLIWSKRSPTEDVKSFERPTACD